MNNVLRGSHRAQRTHTVPEAAYRLQASFHQELTVEGSPVGDNPLAVGGSPAGDNPSTIGGSPAGDNPLAVGGSPAGDKPPSPGATACKTSSYL